MARILRPKFTTPSCTPLLANDINSRKDGSSQRKQQNFFQALYSHDCVKASLLYSRDPYCTLSPKESTCLGLLYPQWQGFRLAGRAPYLTQCVTTSKKYMSMGDLATAGSGWVKTLTPLCFHWAPGGREASMRLAIFGRARP